MAKYSGKTFGNQGGAGKDPVKSPEKLKLNIKKFNAAKDFSFKSFNLPSAWKNLRGRFTKFSKGGKSSRGSFPGLPGKDKVLPDRPFGFPSAGKNSAGSFSGFSTGAHARR